MRKHAVKTTETKVYIFNMSEDVWPFISSMSDTRARKLEIEENLYLSDLRLFGLANEDSNLIFISPIQISETFTGYFKSLFGIKALRILVPAKHSGEISKDILEDGKIVEELSRVAKLSGRLTVTSYACSYSFLDLARELRVQGVDVFTPEAPAEEDAWTVNFYGSKSGIRQLVEKSLREKIDLRMPEGLICTGIEDASTIAAKRYLAGSGVVIKTNKGHSGMGVLLYRPGDLPADYGLCKEEILHTLQKDEYWKNFPIIIEELIVADAQVAGGCPNVEFKISANGRVEFLFYCGMRVTPSGMFRGVEISDHVVPPKLASQIVDIGFFVGKKFARDGYRGYFDIDFILGKDRGLYVTESNVRSTGGTFVYQTARRLLGKDFMKSNYVLSTNDYDVSHLSNLSFPDLLGRLTPVLFDKKTREGVVLVSEHLLLMHKCAYIILGKTRRRAYEIEEQMIRLLEG